MQSFLETEKRQEFYARYQIDLLNKDTAVDVKVEMFKMLMKISYSPNKEETKKNKRKFTTDFE